MTDAEQRRVVALARTHADRGELAQAIEIVVNLAVFDRDHQPGLAYDVRIRWHEVIGAIERAGPVAQDQLQAAFYKVASRKIQKRYDTLRQKDESGNE